MHYDEFCFLRMFGTATAEHHEEKKDAPEKVGAGILFVYQPPVIGNDRSFFEVLLLKRSAGSGNPFTWGLPGGNADPGENLWETATREAREEAGLTIPASGWPVVGCVLTKRGKRLQAHYTVFIVRVPDHEKARIDSQIRLDLTEHSDWGWFALDDLLAKHSKDGPVESSFMLHPVPLILLQQHSDALGAALTPEGRGAAADLDDSEPSD